MIRKLLSFTASVLMLTSAANATTQDQQEALVALRPVIAEWSRNCPDAKINAAEIREALLTPTMNVVIVALGGPGAGGCFGNTEPTYAMVKVRGKWRDLNVGGARIEPLAPGQQAATIVEPVRGTCQITYTWQGKSYTASRTKGCIVDQGLANNRAKLLTAAVLAGRTDSVAPSTQPTPTSTPNENADPKQRLAEIIDLIDKHRLPSWTDQNFEVRMQPYLTREFIAAVKHGARVAGESDIDLWDGDLITAAAGVEHVKLWDSSIIEEHDETALVLANISSTDDPAGTPVNVKRPTMKYWLKKEAGLWKIDDLQYIEDFSQIRPELRESAENEPHPTAKQLFSDPKKYRTPLAQSAPPSKRAAATESDSKATQAIDPFDVQQWAAINVVHGVRVQISFLAKIRDNCPDLYVNKRAQEFLHANLDAFMDTLAKNDRLMASLAKRAAISVDEARKKFDAVRNEILQADQSPGLLELAKGLGMTPEPPSIAVACWRFGRDSIESVQDGPLGNYAIARLSGWFGTNPFPQISEGAADYKIPTMEQLSGFSPDLVNTGVLLPNMLCYAEKTQIGLLLFKCQPQPGSKINLVVVNAFKVIPDETATAILTSGNSGTKCLNSGALCAYSVRVVPAAIEKTGLWSVQINAPTIMLSPPMQDDSGVFAPRRH